MIDSMNLFRYFFLTLVLLLAALTDIRSRKIPNWLTCSAVLVSLIYHTGMSGTEGFLFSLGGVVMGMAILIIPYLMGGMGAGDVKLMAGVGGFLGMVGVWSAFLWTAIIGGLYALAIVIYHSRFKKTPRPYASLVYPYIVDKKFFVTSDGKGKKPRLCYGMAIAIGTFFSFFLKIPLS